MICPRPDCPIEFRAGAIDAYIKREESEKGHKFNAEMPICETCSLCKETKCWVRYADGETRPKRTAA